MSQYQIPVTMLDKKAWVKANVFLKLPTFEGNENLSGQESAYLSVNHDMVAKAVLYQSVPKMSRPHMQNFQALRLIWT